MRSGLQRLRNATARWLLVGWGLACSVYTDDLLVAGGGASNTAGTGGTAGASSTGGQAGIGGVGGAAGQGASAGSAGSGGVGGVGGVGGAGGKGGSAGHGGSGGSGPVYSHTITIDGTNDFTAGQENFATSSGSYTGYFAWDAAYLYVGMEGVDVASGNPDFWLLLYIGGSPGTTTGVAYGSQQPTLPFDARFHLRWKADNGYTNTQQYDGSGWTEANWDFVGDVFQNGEFIELRIPLVDIGSPTVIDVHLNMINEPSGWSYAAVPADSFSDGPNPSYFRHYAFNRTAATVPNGYSSVP